MTAAGNRRTASPKCQLCHCKCRRLPQQSICICLVAAAAARNYNSCLNVVYGIQNDPYPIRNDVLSSIKWGSVVHVHARTRLSGFDSDVSRWAIAPRRRAVIPPRKSSLSNLIIIFIRIPTTKGNIRIIMLEVELRKKDHELGQRERMERRWGGFEPARRELKKFLYVSDTGPRSRLAEVGHDVEERSRGTSRRALMPDFTSNSSFVPQLGPQILIVKPPILNITEVKNKSWISRQKRSMDLWNLQSYLAQGPGRALW
ncbi:hypothetical protein B0H14DRAFT_2607832 [Mycena olivaceomarginata]|nr:hypothetical protein B0H14DRAFT_2607832 [Mycena olivaceomarginata]